MPTSKNQWLEMKEQFKVKKPGEALAKWLNKPDLNPEPLEELLRNAQIVFRWMAKYPTIHQLNVARNKGKLPHVFWDSHSALNKAFAMFAYAPQVYLQASPDERLSWTLVSDAKVIAAPTVQVKWLLQLIEQGMVLKMRRCKQCTSWFFARFAHQEFCKTPCRIKHFAGSEKFKEKRRKYMRGYYALQRSKNVK
jgi:hypothetical protein